MKILIKNGRIIEPEKGLDKQQDIFIKDAVIVAVAEDINEKADLTIDANNKIVMPGIVDMHVHLREPGREDKETVLSATKAGLKGGVTSMLSMPNTYPSIDCVANVRMLKAIIKKTAQANVFISGTITLGRLGKELTDISCLKKEGVLAITDDGSSVDDEKLFLKALKIAKQQCVVVISHCEDRILSNNGVVNLGIVSTILGLRGISKESEYRRVERDVSLAEKADTPIHIAHVSCKESVDIIARAKKRGIRISAETAPHYFALDERAVLGYDTNKKINPPLRNKADVEAIRDGLKKGIVDVISSDHAPHTENEKDIEFDHAEFGSVGLETELAVSITELIEPGILNWLELVRKLTFNPAKILGIDRGTLKKSSIADVVIVDPHKEWVVERGELVSKSKNSCFLGRKLKGKVEYTICAGKVVYKESVG